MNKLLNLLACGLLAVGVAAAQEKPAADVSLKVEKGVAATSVENREPVGESDALPLLVEAGFLAGPRRAVLRP